MITSEPLRWWRRYVAFARTAAFGGATVMLIIAAIGHRRASIPLVIIGAGWAVMGLGSWLQMRRVASSVTATDGRVTFAGPRINRELRIEDLAEFRWSRGDMNRLAPAFFITVAGEKLRVPARMTRTLELLMYIKRANNDFKLPKI